MTYRYVFRTLGTDGVNAFHIISGSSTDEMQVSHEGNNTIRYANTVGADLVADTWYYVVTKWTARDVDPNIYLKVNGVTAVLNINIVPWTAASTSISIGELLAYNQPRYIKNFRIYKDWVQYHWSMENTYDDIDRTLTPSYNNNAARSTEKAHSGDYSVKTLANYSYAYIDSPGFTIGAAGRIDAYFYTESDTRNGVFRYTIDADNWVAVERLPANDRYQATLRIGGVSYYVGSNTSSAVLGEWQKVSLVWNGTNTWFELDGVQSGAKTADSPPAGIITKFIMGESQGNGSTVDAYIDDVTIWPVQ
jgi:hypothetical protein